MYGENYYSETYAKIGKSIFIFNEIEFFIDCIICHFIKPSNREFFINYFLNTSVTSFGTKVKMLTIINGYKEKIFEKNDIEMLRTFVNYRNTFAHSNRKYYPNVDITEPDPLSEEKVVILDIDFEDVIYITNSSGKITRRNYTEYIFEHKNLQNNVINFLFDFVTKNEISVLPAFPQNIKQFLTQE